MSSACSNLLLNSPSPTSKHSPRSDSTDVLLNKFIHIDSPRSSASLFKRPSPASSASKWKSVLSHLTAPRLLPASVSSTLRSSRSRLLASRAVTARISIAPAPIAIAAPAPPAPVDIGSPDIRPLAGTERADPDPQPSLSATIDDVEQLLHVLTESSHASADIDITTRSHAITSLCSLCLTSTSAADRCVTAGGVDIILRILTCNNDASLPVPNSAAATVVEESERALLLLQVLTSSSAEGCATALGKSSFTIAMLGKKLLRVSEACTASVIAVLTTLCRHPEAALFCKAVSETAIPSKLVVVLQVASKDSTKRRAGRLLRWLEQQQQQQQPSESV